MIKHAIHDLLCGKDLTLTATKEVMFQIIDGQATNAQIASFLTAMRMKGETIEEDYGMRPGDAGEMPETEPWHGRTGHCGHGRRRAEYVQHIHRIRIRDIRRGRAGRQAREPERIQQMRQRRPAGSAGGQFGAYSR